MKLGFVAFSLVLYFRFSVTLMTNDLSETMNERFLKSIPDTGFSCYERPAGYYADDDPLSACKVFHYCHHDGRMFNFLCPDETIFNQRFLACDHHYNFDCSTAREFYSLNEQLFKIPIE